jgi:hypothetical protein
MNRSLSAPLVWLAVLAMQSATDGTAQAAAVQLKEFEASYNFDYKGMSAGVTTLKLKHQGEDRWIYSSSGEARGIFRLLPIDSPTQHSELRVVDDQIQPLHFSQSNGNASESRAVDIHFNWDTARVTGSAQGKNVDEAIPADTQDDLSIQLTLLSAVAAGKSRGVIHTYGDNGLREYRFKADGRETIMTALGSMSADILVTERTGSPRVTRYWCAPSVGYLPVRVEQRRLKDLEWTLEIKSLKRE